MSMLVDIIQNKLNETERNWFFQKSESIKKNSNAKDFYLAFTGCHRIIEKNPISFTSQEIVILEKNYSGFTSISWDTEQLCRLVLMLSLNKNSNKSILENLFSTADMKELVVLYRGLFLLENANEFTLRAIEGIRTNMTDVFDAITLHNPFASEYFDENAWNQMVLKAVFMARPLYKIKGLDRRHNRKLAKIAQDFSHERRSAGREVSPELWRLAAGYIDEEIFDDLTEIVEEDVGIFQEAALKSLVESSNDLAIQWAKKSNLTLDPKSWDEIGIEWENRKT